MKKTTQRITSILLAMVLLLGLTPTTVLAAEMTAETENVTIHVNFDYRSVGTAEMLESCEIAVPKNAVATVPSGSTLYEVLEAAKGDAFTPVYGQGFGGSENGYVKAFDKIGDIQTLCENMGAHYDALFQYAGWMYSGDPVAGNGIQNDTVTQDGTVTFRYSVYNFWDESANKSVNVDWNFVDAYDGLQANIAKADTLTQSDYTEAQWTKVQTEKSNAEKVLLDVTDQDTNGFLVGGMTLNYIAEKGSALWGPNSVTDTLQTANTALERAINKIVAPEKIQIPEKVELTVGTDYQLDVKVLPAEASQKVTYDVLLGSDAFTISGSGLIHPTRAESTCMVQVKSAENPSVRENFTFTIKEEPIVPVVPPVAERIESLLTNISNSYTDSCGEWQVMDMGAYAMTHPEGTKLSDTAKQAYINQAIASISDGKANDQKYGKTILALKSQGVDPTQLYPVNSNAAMSAIAGLNGVAHSTSLWSAPYTLMAYRQVNDTITIQEDALIDSLLKSQQEDGSWNEWGTIDTTANAIAALSLYPDHEQARKAVEKGIDYLSKQQKETGAFDDGYGANSNSLAMVAIGLAAAGVNPHTDERFIKNGHSVMDALLSFALDDNSGFGYTDHKTINTGATEQSFRALIAAGQVMKTGKAFNVYDFSKLPAQPGRATGEGGQGGGEVTPAPDADDISVSVTIKADTGYWLNSKPVTVKDGSSVADAFLRAIEGTGISQVGAENGYISSMTKDGRTLAEFTNGPDSGWLYKVNGVLPNKGIQDYALSSQDSVVFYYTNDWTKDPSAGHFTPDDKTETVKHPDGSVTTTVTKPDGSTVATTKKPDGTTIVVDTQKNGAVSTTETRKDGVKVETKTDTKGVTTARVAVPAGKKGVSVSVPVQQKPADSVVLVVVKPDGTEEIVKKSVVDGKSVCALVDESCTLKVKDHAKTFTDTKKHWAADAIAFVSSRELFNGVSESNFAPNDTMNRAMLATVLYRLEGENSVSQKQEFDDVAENSWYTDAVAWASANGVVTGYGNGNFGAQDAITREQLAVMLYRYAAAIQMDTSAAASDTLHKFADDEKVSDWAADAMEWAVSCGIIGGVDGSHLAPKDTATRAQVATMMQRFVKQMVL